MSVSWLVGWLVGWLVDYTLLFFYVFYSLTILLLPKYGPCPPARDWGSRVSGLVEEIFSCQKDSDRVEIWSKDMEANSIVLV